jgi:hypothetical protein
MKLRRKLLPPRAADAEHRHQLLGLIEIERCS